MIKNTLFLFGLLAFLTLKIQAQTTITDVDGNVYNTVTIGTQVWMKENLKTTKYNDGTAIPNVTDNLMWSGLSTGARCYMYNDSVAYNAVYGSLYNWPAVNVIANGGKNVCPSSWHVPSFGEWNIMEIYLDNTVDTTATGYVGTDIGGKLKEPGTMHWRSPNTGATNSSGFSALGGLSRDASGHFITNCDDERIMGFYGCWWTTFNLNNFVKMRYLEYNNNKLIHSNKQIREGLSIRCVRDQLSNGYDENFDKHIQIYPNPAIDNITIDCAENQSVKMHIYNIIGECVLQEALSSGSNVINIRILSKGVYVIRLTGSNWTVVSKLTRE